MSNEHYLNNPLIHEDRRLGAASSDWVKQFDCSHMRPLIICRGPIRKEAMDVFSQMGIDHYGILLSEKDSIVYPRALAPELRELTDPSRVHPGYPTTRGRPKRSVYSALLTSWQSPKRAITTPFSPVTASWPKTKPWSPQWILPPH